MSATGNELVSVVVAAYNMAQYLRLAVQSILAQTYPNIEVHIVNDGSTDATASVADELARDPRVHAHHQSNQGQASAKNCGVKASRGAYIGFLDADDMWLPTKLERQLPLLRAAQQVGVVYSDYACMDGNGDALPDPVTRKHRGRVCGQLLIENFVCFPSVLVRRECFERFGLFDEVIGMGIDYDLWLRLSPHYDFDFVEGPTVRYRIWGGQMSKNYRRRYQNGILIMNRFLEANPGLVPGAVVRKAWAHTYRGRGDSILEGERNRVAAMLDYLRAVRYDPASIANWRSIAKACLPLRDQAPAR
jgi:glycosyltransferase involved in cell wall biosynthesis